MTLFAASLLLFTLDLWQEARLQRAWWGKASVMRIRMEWITCHPKIGREREDQSVFSATGSDESGKQKWPITRPRCFGVCRTKFNPTPSMMDVISVENFPDSQTCLYEFGCRSVSLQENHSSAGSATYRFLIRQVQV